MSTMTELLLIETAEHRITERHAAADARRLAASITPEPRTARTWSVAAMLRLLTVGRRVARPL